jgi:hypothetical protein
MQAEAVISRTFCDLFEIVPSGWYWAKNGDNRSIEEE